jgi:hypothetical protein
MFQDHLVTYKSFNEPESPPHLFLDFMSEGDLSLLPTVVSS